MTAARPGRPWQPLRRLPRRPGDSGREVWVNADYVVTVHRADPGGWVAHLSIRRQDRAATRDWRDFQRIKNQLAGRDTEGVELYPASDRVVDQADQYHIWTGPPGFRFPLGMDDGRQVALDADANKVPGTGQRPMTEQEAEAL